MKKKLSLILPLLLISILSYGQDWKQLQAEGKSFKEIKATMARQFKGKSTLRNPENYSKQMKQYARWEYYWRHQLDAKGNFVNPMEILESWEETKYLDQQFQSAITANWSFVGPNVIPTATSPTYAGMGRINALTFDPSNSQIIWVGAANGGLWKTIDGGTSWESKSDNLPVLGISDIVIASNGHIYIATGDADGSHSVSVGVLKSTDGGNTFVVTGLVNTVTSTATAQFQIHHLWVHPSNPNIVVATTTSGIQRTTDGGATWTNVDQNSSTDIEMKPGDPNTLYVASFNVIVKSTDAGATWSNPIFNGPQSIQKMEIAVTVADPNVIYIMSDDGIGNKSTDGGANWVSFSKPSGYSTQGGYDMTLNIAPNNKDLIILGGVSGWVSTNGGNSWTQQLNGLWQDSNSPGQYVHSDHHVMKFLPGSNTTIFSGHDGGVHKGNFVSSDPWTDLSDGLFITQFYGFDGFPGNGNTLIAGAQDNDGVFYNGTTWKNINNNSDGVGGVIDHSNSNISYMQSQQGFVNRTEDAWANAVNVSVTPSNANDKAGFVWPLEMDPVTPTTLYAGYGNIYKTTDKGDSWTNVTNEGDVTTSYTAISVAPSNPQTVYAVRGGKEIKVSTNGGTSWTTLTNPVSNGTIKNIAASLTDDKKVYIVYSGYNAGEKVYVSTNTGAAWTNMSTGIPNIPVHCITEKKVSGDLYIGTTFGVYTKEGSGTTWSSFNANLPKVTVNALNIHETTSMLRAATFGRGIWKTPLNQTADCPITLEVTANPASGDFKASQTLTTSGTIEVTGTANFTAGTSVTLSSGFHAKAGSSFSAKIETCTPASLNEEELAALSRINDIEQGDILAATNPLETVANLLVAPNPTRDITNLSFDLQEPTTISIHVYNSGGQLIENLANQSNLDKGHHDFLFNGTYQKAGLYYLILRTDKEVLTKKMMVIH